MSDDFYPVDIDSIRRAFPPGLEAPPLLIDFAGWLKDRSWGNVGCYSLVGDFSDNAPVVDGSPLRDKFALFARLPEGSVVGAWYGAGTSPDNAPIVVLGSEGEHEIIAASFAGLFAKIATQRFEANMMWTDFSPHEDAEDQTAELGDWLVRRLGVKDLERLSDPPAGFPDFDAWMEKWNGEREEYWATHPAMAKLSEKLVAHLPEGKNRWDATRFEVAIVGRQYQVQLWSRGRQPIDEAAAIEPILRGLRDDMCREHPHLGLWYQVKLAMTADGRIMPRFDYETRPDIADAPADLTEARADLARAPRPARWVPEWLTT